MARELLDDSSSESDDGVIVAANDLKINSEYARKFEHNKKREELLQCMCASYCKVYADIILVEEKYGKTSKKRKRDHEEDNGVYSGQESSSSSEDEDDAGNLATVALDSEIMATLDAIRSKDPKVYDGKTSFYSTIAGDSQHVKEPGSRPMFLRDYHRENLLNQLSTEDTIQPLTYDKEQQDLKESFVNNMHSGATDSEEDEDLLIAKKRDHRAISAIKLDTENAERDPETFLSNFMASRAWVPTDKTVWQPLESDDEEEERRAEAFEEAYNMRFEDPQKSNETLRSHARDLATRYSVRREDKNARKRKRELEKEKKELDKQLRKDEKMRLRKLRIDEVQSKLQKIKVAAGLTASDLRPEDWSRFVDEEFDDGEWEKEMQQRFGDTYYAKQDVVSDVEGEEPIQLRKPKKPNFPDEIDINDIIPEFDPMEANFSLSEEDQPSSNRQRSKAEQKHETKKERRIIEQLVDNQLQMELQIDLPKNPKGFRYRETSPQSFGLNARDILLADDSLLNQFAGLKKLATFRDPIKKQKDKKHLGKKARLRQWRKEAFGDEDGVQNDDLVPTKDNPDSDDNVNDKIDVRVTGKKRRRSKKRKIVPQESTQAI